MTNPMMTTSPGPPTARKAPSTPQSPASSSSKKSAKRKQQPKLPGSQAVSTGRQRKKSAVSEGPVQTSNKRKVKMEEESFAISSPKHSADASTAIETVLTTPKKQKVDVEAQNRMTIQPSLLHLSPPSQPPSSQAPQIQQYQQPAKTSSAELTRRLLQFVLKNRPGVIPGNPATTLLTSSHINEIAHAMWQAAFSFPGMLEQVCTYAAMYSHVKLAALAKLNYLPSWWLLRESAGMIMITSKWIVDDTVMQTEWVYMVDWCRRNLPAHAPKGSANVAKGKHEEDEEVIEIEDEGDDAERAEK